MQINNINQCWGNLIIEELIRLGCDYFCVAPGSRSSPLTAAIAQRANLKAMVHFDERGLSFHAMGYTAATGKPAVLICTSGTAAANFLPAVIEASKKKLPLIVITADRPPELRQTGAVQTIDQVGIFGKYTKWAFDMPCPDFQIKPSVVLTTVDQALYQAKRYGGVVHLNCMFREPLAPSSFVVNKKLSFPNVSVGNPELFAYLKPLAVYFKSQKPFTQYVQSSDLSLPSMAPVIEAMGQIKNGLIVVGKIGDKGEAEKVLRLADHLGWPIFADVSSGLRLGCKHRQVIHYFDHLLLNEKLVKQCRFDGVLHLGGRITSKRYYDLALRLDLKQYIMVLNHPLRNDPNHQVSLRVEAKVGVFVEKLLGVIKKRPRTKTASILEKANFKADQGIERIFKADFALTEPKVARLVSQLIPKGHGLFLSNSMPIRDMDFYADFKGQQVLVNGNRGASGIDGIIASASGYAQGLKRPVTLMIGDVASLHDLNSLSLLRDIKVPVIIVVLNNGGGGIFSFLPIAQFKGGFEKFWGTPHSYSFANAAAMFECQYSQPMDVKHFKTVYTQALNSSTSTIIEVMTSRNENLKEHQSIQSKIFA